MNKKKSSQQRRVEGGLPFVQALAKRVASSMPNSVELSDLVQDGMIGLIDAANRYDDSRGIKFETFAERRVRGAMIDALRKDAWPRGIRRMRRELEAGREHLRHKLGCEPSLSDLAKYVGSDEVTLGRTIVRINTIESTSSLNGGEGVDEKTLPAVMVPSEPVSPDKECESHEVEQRVRIALTSLPARERQVMAMYYYGDVTMKQIGIEMGVNESRVSQLHTRAILKLRKLLGPDVEPTTLSSAVIPLENLSKLSGDIRGLPSNDATIKSCQSKDEATNMISTVVRISGRTPKGRIKKISQSAAVA